MDFEQIFAVISGFVSPQLLVIVKYVLMALGGLVVIGSAYVKITPTQDDDAWFAKLEALPFVGSVLGFLVKFSPFSRKE